MLVHTLCNVNAHLLISCVIIDYYFAFTDKEHERERKNLFETLKSAQKALLSKWDPNVPFDESVQETNSYVSAVEAIFLHGLKDGSIIKGKPVTLFSTISMVEKVMPQPVMSLPAANAGIEQSEMARAWIRYKLNAGDMIGAITLFKKNLPTTFYEPWAFVLSADDMDVFVSYTELIRDMAFNVALEDPDHAKRGTVGPVVTTVVVKKKKKGVKQRPQNYTKSMPPTAFAANKVAPSSSASAVVVDTSKARLYAKPQQRLSKGEEDKEEKASARPDRQVQSHQEATNPFEDTAEEEKEEEEGSQSNPFMDDPVKPVSVSTNPFDEEEEQSQGKLHEKVQNSSGNPFMDVPPETKRISAKEAYRDATNPFGDTAEEEEKEEEGSQSNPFMDDPVKPVSVSKNPFKEEEEQPQIKPLDDAQCNNINNSSSSNPFVDTPVKAAPPKEQTYFGEQSKSKSDEKHEESTNPFGDDDVDEDSNTADDVQSQSCPHVDVLVDSTASVDSNKIDAKKAEEPRQESVNLFEGTSEKSDTQADPSAATSDKPAAPEVLAPAAQLPKEEPQKANEAEKGDTPKTTANASPFPDVPEEKKGVLSASELLRLRFEALKKSSAEILSGSTTSNNNNSKPPAEDKPRAGSTTGVSEGRVLDGNDANFSVPIVVVAKPSASKSGVPESVSAGDNNNNNNNNNNNGSGYDEENDKDAGNIFLYIMETVAISDYDKSDKVLNLYQINEKRKEGRKKGLYVTPHDDDDEDNVISPSSSPKLAPSPDASVHPAPSLSDGSAQAQAPQGIRESLPPANPEAGLSPIAGVPQHQQHPKAPVVVQTKPKTKGPRVHDEKPPEYWIPSCTELNYYVVPKAKPEANQRCYGCKKPITPVSSARFCEFTGRYFCPVCCTGKKFYIPSYIIHHWDSKKRVVNDTSYEFLSAHVYTQPLIDVLSLNCTLYKLAPDLLDVRQVRKELFHLKDYISACSRLKEADDRSALFLFHNVPAYYYCTTDIYSLSDLVDWSGVLKSLQSVCDSWTKHVAGCPVCTGRGSRCMVCKSDKVIHRFQINDVVTCNFCCSYFHRSCLKKASSCPICTKPLKL